MGGVILGISFILNEYQKKNDNPKVYYKKHLLFGYNGFIIPMVGVFIKKTELGNKDFLTHEMTHWRQYQKEGLFGFLFGYCKEAINKGYEHNKYEIEARVKSGESVYCQTHYCECVKNGMAKAYNPDFRK